MRNWHNVHEKFNSLRNLKKKLLDTMSEDISDKDEFSVGYFEKRSNSKRWIKSRYDIDAMYKIYGTGDTISIWCDRRSGVRKRNPNPSNDEEPRGKQAKKEKEVEEN